MRAVAREPETGSPFSSIKKTRSASPSKANPTSAFVSRTLSFKYFWFSCCKGSAGWFGKVPSSSGKSTSNSKGNLLKTGGRISPPIPFAESATILSFLRLDLSITDKTWIAKSSKISNSSAVPVFSAGSGELLTISRISPSPESCPIGLA